MKKIKSLFVREFENHRVCNITEVVTDGCEWVLAGEGQATRKYDGTCCLIMQGEIYRRYDAKKGKIPPGAIPCQGAGDSVTGHFPHWVKCDENNPSDKWHIKAFKNQSNLPNGTYELCGPHFQGNPDNILYETDILIRHGEDILKVERTFEGIKRFLTENKIEGIVFHRDNGEMCKIKRSDFGLPWGNNTMEEKMIDVIFEDLKAYENRVLTLKEEEMSNKLFHDQIKLLNTIGPVEIHFSDVTNKWYVTVDGLDVKEGSMLVSVTEHRDTIQEAVNAFVQRLVGRGEERVHYVLVPIQQEETTESNEIGKVSNLITDMIIKGVDVDEIARVVRHSMVVIDAEKKLKELNNR